MKPIFRQINPEEEIYKLNITSNGKRGTLVEVAIADIHMGSFDPETQYKILKEQFIEKIKYINFDILSINGDTFDHKFMSNSDVIMYTSLFINEVVDICKHKNATIIIIHGTAYHDASQLKLFYHYLKDPSIDIRIVETIKFEYVKGARILCIPETYGLGKEYYEQFLFNSGSYDSVRMHGVIKGAIYQAKNQESGIHTDKAPTFTIEDFRLCRGLILSGHVHTPGCFNTYFYYCGSPMRYRHGEQEEKGFLIALHNLDTQEHYVHLEPIKSFRYDTVNMDDLLSHDPKDIISYTSKLLDEGIDNIRLEFKQVFTDTQIANLDIIKKYYKNNSRVKIKAEIDRLKKNIEDNPELNDKFKEYGYLLDKSLTEYEILTMYINHKKGYDYISVQELHDILAEEI